jgi:hypothetical protein
MMIYFNVAALIQGHLYRNQFKDQQRNHVLEKHLKLKGRKCQEDGKNCVMPSSMILDYTNIARRTILK